MNKFIFIIIFILFISGCNYTELNNLSIIKSIGIDYRGEYIIYCNILDENEKENIVLEYKCDSIDKCFNNIKLDSNKEINFSHIDLIILSNNLSNSNYKDIFNYFINNNVFRCDYLTIFSDDINNLLLNSKFDEVNDLIISNKDIINCIFNDVMNDYFNKNSIYLSLINYKDNISYDGNLLYKDGCYEKE